MMEGDELRTRYGSKNVDRGSRLLETLWYGAKITLLLLIIVFSATAWYRYHNFAPATCSLSKADVVDICDLSFGLICDIDISDEVLCDTAHLAGLVCPPLRTPEEGECPPQTACTKYFSPAEGACEKLIRPINATCDARETCPLARDGHCSDGGECMSDCVESVCSTADDCVGMIEFITGGESFINCQPSTVGNTESILCTRVADEPTCFNTFYSGQVAYTVCQESPLLTAYTQGYQMDCINSRCVMTGINMQDRLAWDGPVDSEYPVNPYDPDREGTQFPVINWENMEYLPTNKQLPRSDMTGTDGQICNQAIWHEYAGCFSAAMRQGPYCQWWYSCTNWDEALRNQPCLRRELVIEYGRIRQRLGEDQYVLYEEVPLTPEQIIRRAIRNNLIRYGEERAGPCSEARSAFLNITVAINLPEVLPLRYDPVLNNTYCTADLEGPALEYLVQLMLGYYTQNDIGNRPGDTPNTIYEFMDDLLEVKFECIQDAKCFEYPCPADNCGHDGVTVDGPADLLTCGGDRPICEDFFSKKGNCGECGNNCGPGGYVVQCVAGSCTDSDDPFSKECGSVYFDTTSDPDHCGDCWRQCDTIPGDPVYGTALCEKPYLDPPQCVYPGLS